MSPERWARIDAVLDGALDLPTGERAAYLDAACGGDAELRAEVERLLAASDAVDGPLPDQPAAVFAASLVARTLGTGVVDEATGAPVRHPARVGPWRVVRPAGVGGMGTVYVVERDDGAFRMTAALKLVRRGLHLDEQFLHRFRDERQILARLVHPNVARLLDGGVTEDGLPYYVMEYVDGAPIDHWCDGRRLGVDARLALFAKVCDAVAYAHQQRTVHRDLKPSNILVTPEGDPKLLDFGIAKLLVPDAEDAPQATAERALPSALTRTGQRLLTPEYASPEQIRSEPVTAASDVYALGVILYELLTGRRPYATRGRTAHEVERAVLEVEPTRPSAAVARSERADRADDDEPRRGVPPSAATRTASTRRGDRRAPHRDERDAAHARDSTPAQLRRRLRGDLDAVVLTALRKEPARRYPSAAALAADVRRHLEGRPVLARGDGPAYRVRKWARRHRGTVGAAALGMAAGIGLIAAVVRRDGGVAEPGLAERASARVSAATLAAPRAVPAAAVAAPPAGTRLVPGAARRVAFDAALELDPALSPDGARVAYAADVDGLMRIYVRPVAGGPATLLSGGVPGYHRAPRWSPDGREVAFQGGRQIWSVPVARTAPPRVLVRPVAGAAWVGSLTWSPDGRRIAYVQDWRIQVRGASGGRPHSIDAPAVGVHSLAWSPDGRWIAYVDDNAAFVFGARGWGSPVNLGNAAPSAIWVVPAAGGAPVRVTDARSLNTSPAWMPDGRGLLFVSSRDGDRDVYQVSLDAEGHAGAPMRVTAGLGAHTISLSRDAHRLAYSVYRSTANVWSLPVPDSGTVTEQQARQVTSGTQSIEGLAVSPDGRWLAFDSDRNGSQDIHVVSTSGGEPRALTTSAADEFMPHWSPSGREVVYYGIGADGIRRLAISPAAGGTPQPVIESPPDQRFPGWSPDGRSLVFDSYASGRADGRSELWVTRRRPDGLWGPARRVSTAGGSSGRWSPDGRTISYARDDGLWAVSPDGGAARHVLPIDPADEASLGVAQWSPDGRVVYYKWVDEQGRASLHALPGACAAVTAPPPRQNCASRVVVWLGDPRRQSARPEFATDGRRFYLSIAERASDVWAMELGMW